MGLAIGPMMLIRTVGINSFQATNNTKGLSMISEKNSPFKLEKGKLYSYKGAQVQVKDDTMQVVYNSSEHSGAVHEYDGGEWNGGPIDVSKYSKLVIVVQKIEGNLDNIKFELNDVEVIQFGQMKEGENVIDLEKMKKDDFDPLTSIKKINFINKPGQGKYRIQMYLQ